MEIDLENSSEQKDLRVFEGSCQVDDRDFGIFMTEDWRTEMDDSTVLPQNYENLPDLNPVTGAIKNARILIRKGGIPVALGWNAIKAVGVGSGAYELSPGGMDVKAITAGVAVGAMLIGSPTFVVPAGLLVKKYGSKVVEVIRNSGFFNSTSPKP